MGAKDWMLFYADGDVRPILQAAPPLDRAATAGLVARLWPGRDVTPLADSSLGTAAHPADDYVYAGCFPGLTIVCAGELALDRPSQLDARFHAEAASRSMYLHAMHSVVDWFAYAVWSGDGTLRRALSLSPDSGVMENLGAPAPFETPYWAGEFPAGDDEDDEEPYPLPFHPLELAEDALRHLFGFVLEGIPQPDDPELERITLAGHRLRVP